MPKEKDRVDGFVFPPAKCDRTKFDENWDKICTCMFNNCKIHVKEEETTEQPIQWTPEFYD